MTDKITAALEAADKATPGPWEIFEDIFLTQPDIQDRNGRSVATVRLPYPMNEVTRSSNATLIAAAPDLAAEVIRLRKIIATLSRCANKLEMDGVARMSAEERGKWLDKQVEEIETRDENIAEGYGLERKWFAESEEE